MASNTVLVGCLQCFQDELQKSAADLIPKSLKHPDNIAAAGTLLADLHTHLQPHMEALMAAKQSSSPSEGAKAGHDGDGDGGGEGRVREKEKARDELMHQVSQLQGHFSSLQHDAMRRISHDVHTAMEAMKEGQGQQSDAAAASPSLNNTQPPASLPAPDLIDSLAALVPSVLQQADRTTAVMRSSLASAHALLEVRELQQEGMSDVERRLMAGGVGAGVVDSSGRGSMSGASGSC
ncbi:unnamed protein product [Vitrella brassicaformis CCMP3155]|uniref:Uncharacterized protein n=1 Tax=Vitrella brassicaformis (strain CCMP3155) TaxID=1169540 RepID=A0A0G4FM15_VITBC|nr:unnamed protein product [Vitrella brassicaformis CCMP3155]|eukprot:CEM14842.1 unnamed protein product [Vitrella brassicaformis CCMP3155]